MNDAKEFFGKTLDAAIAEACTYYDAGREQLEIEIIEDAKSGIFGLVGVRKAKIMARRAELANLLQERKSPAPKKEHKGAEQAQTTDGAKPAKSEPRKPESRKKDLAKPEKAQARSGESVESGPAERKKDSAERGKPAPAKKEPSHKEVGHKEAGAEEKPETPKQPRTQQGKVKKNQPAKAADDNAELDQVDNPFPKINLTELDQARLEQCCRDVMHRLVKDMVDEVEIKVNINPDRVQVRFECADSGLLIGREGQNLSAIQYLGTRMISRAMDAQIKVQVDAGDYQNRQDQRLQEMAMALAQRVRTGGRSASTKPMSAYQRRIIHLTLQDEPDLQTRSSGDGALKRVVVMKRKDN